MRDSDLKKYMRTQHWGLPRIRRCPRWAHDMEEARQIGYKFLVRKDTLILIDAAKWGGSWGDKGGGL